jgi:hypothetical protein
MSEVIHVQHNFRSKEQVSRLSFHGFPPGNFQDNNLDHDRVLLLTLQFIIHDSRQDERFSLMFTRLAVRLTHPAVQCIYQSSLLVSS